MRLSRNMKPSDQGIIRVRTDSTVRSMLLVCLQESLSVSVFILQCVCVGGVGGSLTVASPLTQRVVRSYLCPVNFLKTREQAPTSD